MSIPAINAQPDAVHLTLAQKAELDRRLDALDDGTVDVISWGEAKRRLRS